MIIIMVLLQAGKGSSLGAALGGGSNQTLFGPTGSGNILTKITTGLAIVFMLTSISLAYMSGKSTSTSVVDRIKQEAPIQTNSVSDKVNETAEKEASN